MPGPAQLCGRGLRRQPPVSGCRHVAIGGDQPSLHRAAARRGPGFMRLHTAEARSECIPDDTLYPAVAWFVSPPSRLSPVSSVAFLSLAWRPQGSLGEMVKPRQRSAPTEWNVESRPCNEQIKPVTPG